MTTDDPYHEICKFCNKLSRKDKYLTCPVCEEKNICEHCHKKLINHFHRYHMWHKYNVDEEYISTWYKENSKYSKNYVYFTMPCLLCFCKICKVRKLYQCYYPIFRFNAVSESNIDKILCKYFNKISKLNIFNTDEIDYIKSFLTDYYKSNFLIAIQNPHADISYKYSFMFAYHYNASKTCSCIDYIYTLKDDVNFYDGKELLNLHKPSVNYFYPDPQIHELVIKMIESRKSYLKI